MTRGANGHDQSCRLCWQQFHWIIVACGRTHSTVACKGSIQYDIVSINWSRPLSSHDIPLWLVSLGTVWMNPSRNVRNELSPFTTDLPCAIVCMWEHLPACSVHPHRTHPFFCPSAEKARGSATSLSLSVHCPAGSRSEVCKGARGRKWRQTKQNSSSWGHSDGYLSWIVSLAILIRLKKKETTLD
jgi:hypothetical protein